MIKNENRNGIALRCEDIPLVRLKKLKCRKIDMQTLSRIRASIEELGLLEPLLVTPIEENDFGILDGDGRYDVLMEMGMETAPCIIQDTMDIYTANHQVNHLSPVEETRMIKKAMETVDGQLIAKVFGFKKISFRLSDSLINRLHPTVVKAFNSGKITKLCAKELAEVTPDRQLEIFAMMQNTKNFGPNFVKKQILLTPIKKQQSKRKMTPWLENKKREKSMCGNLKEMNSELNSLAMRYREYTAALMLTVVHAREIITNKAIEKYLRENLAQLYREAKEIIESELIEKKGIR